MVKERGEKKVGGFSGAGSWKGVYLFIYFDSSMFQNLGSDRNQKEIVTKAVRQE